jgi:hypothetical protein
MSYCGDSLWVAASDLWLVGTKVDTVVCSSGVVHNDVTGQCAAGWLAGPAATVIVVVYALYRSISIEHPALRIAHQLLVLAGF